MGLSSAAFSSEVRQGEGRRPFLEVVADATALSRARLEHLGTVYPERESCTFRFFEVGFGDAVSLTVGVFAEPLKMVYASGEYQLICHGVEIKVDDTDDS